jgi:hypothetical protein
VRLRTVAAVGLECALGHRDPLLFPKENPRFSINSKYNVGEFRNPAEERASRCGKGDAEQRLC